MGLQSIWPIPKTLAVRGVKTHQVTTDLPALEEEIREEEAMAVDEEGQEVTDTTTITASQCVKFVARLVTQH